MKAVRSTKAVSRRLSADRLQRQFRQFFRELWGKDKEPFPWQTMLAAQVANDDWPKVIKLPTASGKTACLDIAVFALAMQAARPLGDRNAPRRVWFVVDRRIVVDEAFRRGERVAAALRNAKSGLLKEVAERLCFLSGTERPLATARLRGGVLRDDGWARLPSQPAIITSTVDQLGSRLLFRAYGPGDCVAPIHAALAANDSLILLDEAHCAVPFMQTLESVARFRGATWAKEPLGLPFAFSVMSATPPKDGVIRKIFPGKKQEKKALDHPLLRRRLEAKKLTELVITTPPKPGGGRPLLLGKAVSEDGLVLDAAQRAMEFVATDKRQRVAVMVNRVATAEAVSAQLHQDFPDRADIVLLTGRMRPLDRDDLLGLWERHLRANDPEPAQRPIILVTTQCLEVGADFSFDALITECASLDALQQRFGRLNRLGVLNDSPGVILVRERDIGPKADDPIYGQALARTWEWLNSNEVRQPSTEPAVVDFGVRAMNTKLAALGEVGERGFLAPTADAPVLLPAHVDMLCQTSPRPDPEPDVSLFLHGKRPPVPEAFVVWRTDLLETNADMWLETVSLLPPTAAEMLQVPLFRLRRWLEQRARATEDSDSDVEGRGEVDAGMAESGRRQRHFLIWRGRNEAFVSDRVDEIRPGALIVVPASYAFNGLGQRGPETGLGEQRVDLAERSFLLRTGKPVLRLNRHVLQPWTHWPPLGKLLALATEEEMTWGDLAEALEQLVKTLSDSSTSAAPETADAGSPLPSWLAEIIRALAKQKPTIDQHPTGGLLLLGKQLIASGKGAEEDFFADEDDLPSASEEGLTLAQHTRDTVVAGGRLAKLCLAPKLVSAVSTSLRWHDIGKLDPRFQVLLRNGHHVAAEIDEPLAKSERLPSSRNRRRQLRSDAGLPHDFRHEVLSMQLVESKSLLNSTNEDRELVLHLIASHHGYARPFTPVSPDDSLPAISLSSLGLNAEMSAAERQALVPAYHLDSGIGERFWRLTRRFGWWGLASIEAVMRLSDWYASRRPGSGGTIKALTAPRIHARSPQLAGVEGIPLTALDGANPLAYLAALGAFRLASLAWADRRVRLGWEQRLGGWRPILHVEPAVTPDELVTGLHASGIDLPVMFPGELLQSVERGQSERIRLPISAYRDYCQAVSSREAGRLHFASQYAACWASEMTSKPKEETVRRTIFDFTSGNQTFVGNLRELRRTCRLDDLRESLFTGWRYSKNSKSMRWDPLDEKRQYALQASDPTNAADNPPLAVLGANFLAVEALPLFPMVPNRRASQPGFDRGSEGRTWTWVVWRPPITLDLLFCLIAREWGTVAVTRPRLRHDLGIGEVFQSAIVQPSGRYRCFTSPRAL